MVQVIFEVTWRCPCRCPHCTVPKADVDMSLEGFARALRLFNEFFGGEVSAVISGGEPSVSPRLGDYVRCAKRLGSAVTVATNAYNPWAVIDARPDLIEVSVDYFMSRHDRNRGVDGLFWRAMGLIEAALGNGIPVAVRATALRDNIEDIISIRRYLDDRGFGDVPVLVMPVRGDCPAKPSEPDLERLRGVKGVFLSDSCPAGVGSFVVTPELDVLACIFYRARLGSLRSFKLDEVKGIVDAGRKIPRFPCEK